MIHSSAPNSYIITYFNLYGVYSNFSNLCDDRSSARACRRVLGIQQATTASTQRMPRIQSISELFNYPSLAHYFEDDLVVPDMARLTDHGTNLYT